MVVWWYGGMIFHWDAFVLTTSRTVGLWGIAHDIIPFPSHAARRSTSFPVPNTLEWPSIRVKERSTDAADRPTLYHQRHLSVIESVARSECAGRLHLMRFVLTPVKS